ncbi:hypothetical protein [Sphingomonas desiccabilis]|uniref:Uncharacterized protein n=1 Tax=Sphingomonas desiccabilis TaxID=429134 RepID=A0A4Q2IWK7_9SPHN|nr:hypothetical protein [Sphingomonas desiccabilis]MBB3910147.1 hypothetical protein [Sphingomonas desiccabilis]RXZ34826.1 hypothetical protein EO081_03980 [Sphingomonas desiccabilis]
MFEQQYKSQEVFGVTTEILTPSYVNRGGLDARIEKLLGRDTHIALRGESKCGKSWLRKKNIPDAITVQCRLGKGVRDLYTDALAQLGLQLVTERTSEKGFKANLEASGEFAVKLLGKIAVKLGLEGELKTSAKSIPVGRDLDDLRFVSEIINESGRRLVIEDFHYLPHDARKAFAFDLKALWDYRTYVVIIGIWSENNLLLHLNSDLTGRVREVSIFWSADDLRAVLEQGSEALNISFSRQICGRLIHDSYGTVGILQTLALGILDEAGVERRQPSRVEISDEGAYESAAMAYADQLNAQYQTFAARVAAGIRRRTNATGIYAHMLKVVMEASVADLSSGFPRDQIYRLAAQREPRIQKPNLRQILLKIDGLQVDGEGRGLVLSYDEQKDEVFVVDKQLFFYRQYATAKWPWESIIEQVDETGAGYESDLEFDLQPVAS